MLSFIEYDTVTSFAKEVEPELYKDEVLHGLPLGLLSRLKEDAHTYGESAPVLAALHCALSAAEFGDSTSSVVMFALMTPPYPLLVRRIGHESPCCTKQLIHSLVEGLFPKYSSVVSDVQGEVELAKEFARMWVEKLRHGARDDEQQCGTPVDTATINSEESFKSIRLYRINGAPEEARRRSDCLTRLGTKNDIELLMDWMDGFERDAGHSPGTAQKTRQHMEKLVQEGNVFLLTLATSGEAVSTTRVDRATQSSICVSYVYTPPQHRGKGYATYLVRHVVREMFNEPRSFSSVSLFADAGNPISCGIYEKIGFTRVAEFVSLRIVR